VTSAAGVVSAPALSLGAGEGSGGAAQAKATSENEATRTSAVVIRARTMAQPTWAVTGARAESIAAGSRVVDRRIRRGAAPDTALVRVFERAQGVFAQRKP
jgi:hypothetical protein